MKHLPLFLLSPFLISSATLLAQTPGPAPETVVDVSWANEMQPDFIRYWPFTGSADDKGLYIGYHGTQAIDVPLRTFGPAITSKITGHRFGIIGRLKYNDMPYGCYLELFGTFSTQKPSGPIIMSTRTMDNSGPSAALIGTDQGRDIVLTSDTTGTSVEGCPLMDLKLILHLEGGPCGIDLLGLKLVQYPDAGTAPLVHVPTPGTPSAVAIKLILTTELAGSAGYTLDGKHSLTLDPLNADLLALHQKTPGASIVIEADRSLAYADLRRALDAARYVGFQVVKVSSPSDVVASTPTPAAATPGMPRALPLNPNASAPPTPPEPFAATPPAGTASTTGDSEIPPGQTVIKMPWNFVPTLPSGVYGELHTVTDANDRANFITLSYEGPGPLQVPVRNYPLSGFTGTPPIATHHYAIIGKVRCENVTAGSYLEMWSHFVSPTPGVPDQAFFTRTLAPSGPMGTLEGTHDWREFWLPFDSTGTNAKLSGLDFNLHLAGPGIVSLQGLRLAQYADGPSLAASASPSNGREPTDLSAVKWTWFGLGIATTLLTALAGGAAFYLFRKLQTRHHLNELRRIASLDT